MFDKPPYIQNSDTEVYDETIKDNPLIDEYDESMDYDPVEYDEDLLDERNPFLD